MSITKSRFSDPIRADLLQRQCNHILEGIYHADSTASLHRVEALKKEYNELSYQLECLRCGVLQDPMTSLPTEVWTEIIRQATYWNDPEVATTYSIMSSTDALLVLTLVCKDWANLLLGAPGLWTNIEIGHGGADAQAKLQVALSLSRDLPITLVLYVPQCQWDADLPVLLQHVHRIKSLTVLHSSRVTDQFSVELGEPLCRFFLETGPFPGLQSIREILARPLSSYMDVGIILDRCPALTHADRLMLTLDHALNRTAAPLRACTMLAVPRDVVRYAKAFEYVEDLELYGPSEKTHTTTNGGDASLPCLPALKSIKNYWQLDADFLFLLRLGPNLAELVLVLRDNWQLLHAFFGQLDQLPSLSSLAIRIAYIPGIFTPSSAKPVATRVRNLFVDSYVHDQGFDSIRKEDFKSHEALLSVFPAYFPCVEALDLWAIPFGPNLAEYIRSVPCLRSLRLSNLFVLPDTVLASTSLESMDLDTQTASSLQSIIAIVQCPGLSRLTMTHRGIENGLAIRWQAQCKPMVYGAVRNLEIGSSLCGQWPIPDFTSLRTLRLWWSGDQPNRVNELFLALTIEPADCPALEEMELGFIPEWDLFFIMLERRNYIPPSQGVARIKTIILQSPIPYMLLAPLVDILGGRFTIRPSNFDLSFSGFMDIYFDFSIRGCRKCLRSLAPCSAAPVETQALTEKSFLFPLKVPCEQPGVPDDVWRWLRGRDERLLDWTVRSSASSVAIERSEVCEVMSMAPRRFIITTYSLGSPVRN